MRLGKSSGSFREVHRLCNTVDRNPKKARQSNINFVCQLLFTLAIAFNKLRHFSLDSDWESLPRLFQKIFVIVFKKIFIKIYLSLSSRLVVTHNLWALIKSDLSALEREV